MHKIMMAQELALNNSLTRRLQFPGKLMCACQLSMLIHLQQGFEYSFTKYLNPPHAFISWRVSCLL